MQIFIYFMSNSFECLYCHQSWLDKGINTPGVMCGLKSEKVKLVIGNINLMSNSPDYLYFQQLWLTKSKYLRVLFNLKNGKGGTILYCQCLQWKFVQSICTVEKLVNCIEFPASSYSIPL